MDQHRLAVTEHVHSLAYAAAGIQKQVALLRRTLREESHVDMPKDAAPIRIIPWSGQTKDGREEIYAVLDGFLTEEAGQENL